MTAETVYGVGSAHDLASAEARARASAASAISVDVREEMSDQETLWVDQGERSREQTQTKIDRAVDSFVVRRLDACETRSKCHVGNDVHALVACERQSALERRMAEAAKVIAAVKLPAGATLLSVPGIDDEGYVTQLGEYAARLLRDGVARALSSEAGQARIASSAPWRPMDLHQAARESKATHLLRIEHFDAGGTRVHVSCYVQDTQDDHRVPGTDVAFDIDLEPSQAALLALRGPLLPQKDAQDFVNTTGTFRLPIRLSGTELTEGESVQMFVQVPSDSYVYVYDVYEDGRVVLLHPSPLDRDNHFGSGSSFELPSAAWKKAGVALRACPLGRQLITREYVKVIASSVPLDLQGAKVEGSDFASMRGGPESKLEALREELEALARSGVPVGTADMPYFIHAKREPEPSCEGS